MATTARLQVRTVEVAQDYEAHHYRGDDGFETCRVFSVVHVVTRDGRDWVLPNGERQRDEEGFTYYHPRYDADEQAEKVRRRGSIDPDFGVELEPEANRLTLEERFALYAEEDAMERMGFYGFRYGI